MLDSEINYNVLGFDLDQKTKTLLFLTSKNIELESCKSEEYLTPEDDARAVYTNGKNDLRSLNSIDQVFIQIANTRLISIHLGH